MAHCGLVNLTVAWSCARMRSENVTEIRDPSDPKAQRSRGMVAHEQVWVKVNALVDAGVAQIVSALDSVDEIDTSKASRRHELHPGQLVQWRRSTQNRPGFRASEQRLCMATSIEQWLEYRKLINCNVFESAIKRRTSLHCRTYFKPSSPSYCWMTA